MHALTRIIEKVPHDPLMIAFLGGMAADLSVNAQLPLVWEQLKELSGISAVWMERGLPLADPQQLLDAAAKMDAMAGELRILAELVEAGHGEN